MEISRQKGKSTLLTINGTTKSIKQWSEETGVSSVAINRRIRNGCSEDQLFDIVKSSPRYSFNECYFDVIDDEHKAYWLGFIWCDGYMAIRNRDNRTSYEFKLSLKDSDAAHLEKFNKDLNGNYKINYYQSGGFSGKGQLIEARLLITNQHFGKTLVNNYGLIPNRIDCHKLLKQIPEDFIKHFIRGMLDADGSVVQFDCIETKNNKEYLVNKLTIDIGGHIDILKYIEKHLIDNNIINNFDRKLNKRHEELERDGEYRNLKLCGKQQGLKVLHYLYDEATIYLDRKYQKSLGIIQKLEGYNAISVV